MKIAETMKTMAKTATREERLQAQDVAREKFMRSIADGVSSRGGFSGIIPGGRD